MSIVQQFAQLWNSASAPPDVFAFLKQQRPADSDQWLKVLLADQQRRWQTDQPLHAEDYLAGLPELPAGVDWKLQLAIGEFEARRKTDRPLSLQDISSRFPHLSETLRERLRQLSPADAASSRAGNDTSDSVAIDSLNIDRICDAFEAIWNTPGETPRLEEFLQQAPAAALEGLLPELLQIELWWRKQRGQTPAWSDYVTRFPEHERLFRKLLSQPVVSSRRQSRAAAYLPGDQMMPTQIKAPGGGSSTVTYITSNAIGVQQKGRYRLDRVLGEGAFGRVYLGFDEELHRQVAIKVPTKDRFQKPEDAEAYLAEARTVASLDHPHIVPVYDMGRTEDGSIYVVSRFIDGSTLEDRIKAGRPAERESAQMLATIARALQHAHERRLIHRDVKPANILLEGKSTAPYVADFGLAIREEDYLKQNAIAGTPAYMSPEQIRGEGHRLDGRSDVFSLGVILYELLTGKKPFRGSTMQETLHLVLSLEPRPPRELVETIPAELERICLKALSKRASDRYATAADFAEDLEQWLKPAAAVAQTKAAVQVVPKGLRSFDANDADFFLELLPGQRNRDGLPESIAFWKQRIEESDPEQTFSVGLIYGPSGCGKSSLVKAGLLPHLSDSVIAVYVEATPEDTEARIMRGLDKRLNTIGSRIRENSDESAHDRSLTGNNRSLTTSATGLADTLAALRRGQGDNTSKKVVIIIDQFEQWLHAHRAEPEAKLVKALRQCDGGRLQAIVMVRDDFSMAASRFMHSLDTRIVEGHNFATVDLFEVDHAAKVLTRFGQAFGKLPANTGNLSDDERQFVNNVAQGLAQDNKVVSVRLSLFAEMIKGKPWKTATLEQVGGTQGIGVNFLEETFSSPQSNPDHKLHAVAARGVLRALLPGLDTDIKGGMRSQHELQEAVGYENRPADFADLLRILDGELRLITPTDPEGHESQSKSDLGLQYYQLTHDYLVPSLREWLTRKQRETRKGRAELTLEERSALWNAKPENRHLPSLTEWISIRTLTESKHWTASQRVMMSRAGRVHGLRSGLAIALLMAIVFTGLSINKAVNDRQEKLIAQKQEEQNQAEATRLVEGLLAANTAQVSTSLTSLKEFRTWADPPLQQAFQNSAADSDAKLHAGLALVAEGQAVDPAVLQFLQERILTVTAAQCEPVRTLLAPHKAAVVPEWWKVATDDEQPAPRRFRAACALAAFDPTHPSWNDSKFVTLLAEQLVAVSPEYIGQFKELIRPVAPQLVPALSNIFKDPSRGELAKTLATSLLTDYAAKDPDTLTELVLAADVVSEKSLFPVLQQHQPAAVKNLEAVLDQRLEPDWKDAPLDAAWTEPSAAVRAQIESSHGLITDRFAFCQDMPLSEFHEVAEALRASGFRLTRVRPHLSLLPLAGGEGGRRPDEGVADLAATPSLQSPSAAAVSQGLSQSSTAALEAREGDRADGTRRVPATLVSAIWTRDNQRWHIDSSLSKADLPAPDAPATKDGLLLTDIAIIPSTDESVEPQFIALWSEPANADEQRRVLLDVTAAELDAAQPELSKQGFISQSTITVWTDSGGQRHYTGLWSNQGAPSELRPAYAGFELVEQPQWDVAVAPAAKLADPLETFRQQLAQIEKLPAEKLDEPPVREARATAHYQLGNMEAALADLDFLISKQIVTASVLQYRTLTLARLGRADEAKESLTKYLVTDAEASYKHYVQIQVPAWLGEAEQATAQLESAITASGQTSDDLYNVVCAAALCSQALSMKDATESQRFANRTFDLLRQMIAQGYSNAGQLKSDADFASLHPDPRFTELLAQLEPPATYAALWRADVEFESKLLTAVPVESLLDLLKPLIAQGFRPFAIAAAPVVAGFPTEPPPLTAGLPSSASTGGVGRPAVVGRAGSGDPRTTATCSLVLHRPLIPDAAKESLALQQAAAATALLRLNAPEKVWPLFQHQPDPRLRSYVLHRLATYGVDPQSLFAQLQQESDTSRQRSLILGLGEFARAQLLSPEQQAAVIADLAKRYADDPDSGIHGAAEWTLRQLGADTAIAEVRAAYSTGTTVGDRRWYLTKTGGIPTSSSGLPSPASSLTFAIIDADEEFLMGSPVSEAERYEGPTGKNEIRHRRRIGRRFAIGMHEVTVAQFQAFRSDHKFDRTKAREEDSPANVITWYDAAAYCNSLSKAEGLPPEQWCYDPAQPFAEGMPLVPDYLQRTGYRLPSEAEWEYACRAGTTTSRYFGETETLLGEYAWYTKTSGDKWMLPVGSLRPNGFGLFDMQGNVFEWCQDAALLYGRDAVETGDREQVGKLSNSSLRVLRGGSFGFNASVVRSATRLSNQPASRYANLGFRVGRTLLPVPLTALPPAEGGSKFEN